MRAGKKPSPTLDVRSSRKDCQPTALPYDARIKTNIRDAQIADANTIADFNVLMAKETEGLQLDRQRVLAGVTTLIQNSQKGAYFLAEIENDRVTRIAGQLLITYEWSDWRNGNFWWIQSVFVTQAFRGQGVFRALYEHAHQLAKAQQACGLRLYVETHNENAQKTYERLGLMRRNYEFFELDFVLGPPGSSAR